MKVSRFGHFFFLLMLVLIIVSIVAFIKEGILKGALWLGVAAVCWFIGFYHDVRLLKRGKLFSEHNHKHINEKNLYKEPKEIINDVNTDIKKDQLSSNENRSGLYNIMYKDINNPAFNEIINNYSLDIKPYSMIADIMIEVAIDSALHLANANSLDLNKNIVHLFYDLYVALNSKLYHSDNDKASIITDGIHIKYFGQYSLTVVKTLFELRAIKEECFLVTFISMAKDPNFVQLLGSYFTYFLYKENAGITKASFNSATIIDILKNVTPKLKDNIIAILK